MKKAISLILCVIMLAGALAGCTTLEPEDKGAVINAYLTSQVYDFDPALGFNDDAAVKIFGLIYEGLTRINENGKVEKALAKDVKIVDKDGKFKMQITLNATKWSDGRAVQANDIVFAWKRLLDPDFANDAAALLYDIKNARAVKTGDATIDDLGIAAIDTYILEIEFEEKIDTDLFMETLASPALVPLREDIVVKNANWAKKSSTMATNGPFMVKSVEYGVRLILERSSYYYLDSEKEEALDKYVIPYRISINFTDGRDAQLDAMLNKSHTDSAFVFYMGDIPLSQREAQKENAEITDFLNAHTYYFNTTNALFAKPEVRRALSMAIDRNEIAKIVTYATPATGLITNGVFDGTTKTTFREVGGDIISASADVAGAKSLLSSAGVTSGSFTIKIRDNGVNSNEVELAIANYVAGVWNSLGFSVTVETVKPRAIEGDSTIFDDRFQQMFAAGEFDVIGIDMQMLATDAFGNLASFATPFSGNGVDMSDENYELIPHITGYSSEAYDALIESAYAEKDRAARAVILHDAEKMLLDDMPVIPVIFYQDAYIYRNELSGIGSSYYGTRNFKKMKLKDYMNYKAAEETTTAPAS
jgi:ABC-type oligopeptide transport system, periplasmic component